MLQVDKTKTPILVKAADKLLAGGKFKGLLSDMKQWAQENAWCEDSAVFYSLTHHNEETKDRIWWSWEGPLRQAGLLLQCGLLEHVTGSSCLRQSQRVSLKAKCTLSSKLPEYQVNGGFSRC